MRRLRSLAAAVLGAGLLTVLPADVAAASTADTVVVMPDGTPSRTTFTTNPGATYRIAVTGAYSYNGRQNLADCGWWNPETAGDAWFPGQAFRLDGTPAECTRQPYTMTHAYTWLEPGTGAPFTFHVFDSMPWDNIGSLVVEVVEVNPAPSVRKQCAAQRVARDSEIDGDVVHAVLRVSAAGVATSVGGMCRFVGPKGTVATVYASGIGPEAVGADVLILPIASYSVCTEAWAWFVQGSSVYSGETCAPL